MHLAVARHRDTIFVVVVIPFVVFESSRFPLTSTLPHLEWDMFICLNVLNVVFYHFLFFFYIQCYHFPCSAKYFWFHFRFVFPLAPFCFLFWNCITLVICYICLGFIIIISTWNFHFGNSFLLQKFPFTIYHKFTSTKLCELSYFLVCGIHFHFQSITWRRQVLLPFPFAYRRHGLHSTRLIGCGWII